MNTYRELYNEMKDKIWRTFVMHKEDPYSNWDSLMRICAEPATDSIHDLKIIIEYENIFRELSEDGESENRVDNIGNRMMYAPFDTIYTFHYQKNKNKVDIEISESNLYNDLHVNMDDRFDITFSSVPSPPSTMRSMVINRLDNFNLEEVILKSNKNIVYRNIDINIVPLVKFFNDNGLPTISSYTNRGDGDTLVQIVFDEIVTARDIRRFQSEHLDGYGDFHSSGNFTNILHYKSSKPVLDAKYVYIASNIDAAFIDLRHWIDDKESGKSINNRN